MSNIEKLLKGVEVEWKTLGEITKVLRGKRLTREALSSTEKYPVFHGGLEPLGYYSHLNRLADTIMIINVGASAGTVGYSSIDFWSSDGTYCIERIDELNNKFLYYFLLGEQHFLKSRVRVAGIPTLDAFVIEKLQIPILCPNNPEKSLEIQQEIVRILDKFSTLTAELQAELQARKSQYEYYLNQLLTYPMEESDQPSLRSSRSATSIQNSNNPTQPLSTPNPHTGNSVLQPRGKVEWETLGEIFNLKNGYTPSKSNQEYWENGTIPWFRMEDIRENGRVLNKSIQYVNSCAVKGGKLFPANSIIVATSATIGEHALITVPFLSNQRFTNLSLKKEYADKFIIKFLFYYGFVLDEWCKNNITIGNFAGVDMIGFKKFLIPIPPLEEQKRIVSILDKFETLTTSITEGLPKEIELRQKQYEYYRDMLLSFPKNNIKV